MFINKYNNVIGLQASANPWTSVRFRYAPPLFKKLILRDIFNISELFDLVPGI